MILSSVSVIVIKRESYNISFVIMENVKSIHALIQIISMWNFSLILYTSYVVEYCGKNLLEIVALSLMPCLGLIKMSRKASLVLATPK